MPNELHFSFFPGLLLNRESSGEWSLGLGCPQASATVAHLGSPETSLLPAVRNFINHAEGEAVRLGTGLFTPRPASDEFQSLIEKIRAHRSFLGTEVSLAADVRRQETQSGVHRGSVRALQRLRDDFQDIPAVETDPTPQAPIDSPELLAARDRLREYRDLEDLERRLTAGQGDRALLVAVQVQVHLMTGDPDGALEAARRELRDHPDTPGVSELASSLTFAKRRYAAQVVLQACNVAIAFEASHVSEYRAGLLRNAVAPGMARFQNQVETTARPLTELISELYASDPHFGLVLREQRFGDVERVIARDGAFHELDTVSADFARRLEESESSRYVQFLFNLTGVLAESNEAFLKNVSTIVGYRIVGRIAWQATELTMARGAAGFGVHTAANAAAMPLILDWDRLTPRSYAYAFVDNLAFSASMSVVPRLPGVLGHVAAVAGMTAYTYATDADARIVNPLLAMAYQSGQHVLGRLGHVSPERMAAEMEATRIVQPRIDEKIAQGLDVLARAALHLGRPIFGLAVGAIDGNGEGGGPRPPRIEILATNENTPQQDPDRTPVSESALRMIAQRLHGDVERLASLPQISADYARLKSRLRNTLELLDENVVDPTLRGEVRDLLIPQLMFRHPGLFTDQEISDVIDHVARLQERTDPEGQDIFSRSVGLMARIFQERPALRNQISVPSLIDRIDMFVTEPTARRQALRALFSQMGPEHLRSWVNALLRTDTNGGEMMETFDLESANARLAHFRSWLMESHGTSGQTRWKYLQILAGESWRSDTIIMDDDGDIFLSSRVTRIQGAANYLSQYFESIGQPPLPIPEAAPHPIFRR